MNKSKRCKHVSAKIFMEKGHSYRFSETDGGNIAFYVNGQKLLSDDVSGNNTSRYYTAEESGYFDLDVFTASETLDYFSITVQREINGAAAVAQQMESRFQYLDDYKNIVDGTLGRHTLKNSIEVVDAKIESYSGAAAVTVDGILNFVDSHTADWERPLNEFSNTNGQGFGAGTLHHLSARIYVEAGKAYRFAESTDDIALLYVDGREILNDSSYNTPTAGVYVADHTGYVDLNFYAQNGVDIGRYELKAVEIDPADVVIQSKTRASHGFVPKVEVASRYSLYNSDFELQYGSMFSVKDYMAKHSAFRHPHLSLDQRGDVPNNMLNHISGYMFFKAGESYIFKENSADLSLLVIDGEVVIHDTAFGNSGVTGAYTALKSGYVKFDYYNMAKGVNSSYQLKVRVDAPGTVYEKISVTADTHNNADFALHSARAATEAGLAVLHSVPAETPEVIGGRVDSYSGASVGTGTDALRNYAQSHNASARYFADDAENSVEVGNHLDHLSGQIYLEAGKTYSFQEGGENFSSLYIDERNVFSGQTAASKTSTYTASKTGYFDFNFYSWSSAEESDYGLEIAVGDNVASTAFVPLTVKDTLNDVLSEEGLGVDVTAAHFTREAYIVGTKFDDVIEGSSHADLLIGGYGNDILQGGTGNDIFIGSEGADRYVIGQHDGRNVLYTRTTGEGAQDEIVFHRDGTGVGLLRWDDKLAIVDNDTALIVTDFFGSNAVNAFEKLYIVSNEDPDQITNFYTASDLRQLENGSHVGTSLINGTFDNWFDTPVFQSYLKDDSIGFMLEDNPDLDPVDAQTATQQQLDNLESDILGLI